MPLTAWLGSSEAPGEAAGYGPLGADDCRDLAGDLAAAGKGQVVHHAHRRDGRAVAHGCARASPRLKDGSVRAWLAKVKLSRIECGTCTHERETRAYRPPDLMRHLVNIRQRTCAFPGCRRPAERCDLDHTTPFDQGGRTCPMQFGAALRAASPDQAGTRLASCFNPNPAPWPGPHPTAAPTKPNPAATRSDCRRDQLAIRPG